MKTRAGKFLQCRLQHGFMLEFRFLGARPTGATTVQCGGFQNLTVWHDSDRLFLISVNMHGPSGAVQSITDA